ncbi:hypothetical protein VTK56DRAFT_6678 [Thermocarpiscus australiensis]
MLERFYDPSTGNIRVDSDVLTELNPRLYRRIVSLVQQEPTLFQGSIRENIALGVSTTLLLLRRVNKSPTQKSRPPSARPTPGTLSRRLPEGLATAAGSHGTQLSGGQRQRIAIARALVRPPAGPAARRGHPRARHREREDGAERAGRGGHGGREPRHRRRGAPVVGCQGCRLDLWVSWWEDRGEGHARGAGCAGGGCIARCARRRI